MVLQLKNLFSFMCLVSFIIGSQTGYSWGERGHDIVTRVAARLVYEREANSFGDLLVAKENMLGHISNIPDISWRNGDKSIASKNAPTHYVDFEYVVSSTKDVKFNELPLQYSQFSAAVLKNCSTKDAFCPKGKTLDQKMDRAGHAQFRVEQFVNLALESGKKIAKLRKVKASKDDLLEDEVIKFLGFLGLMSHFVGDLANPHHTSVDYDGQQTGQGGFHQYFESLVVSSLPLSLDGKVFDYASKQTPYKSLTKQYPISSPLDMVYALIIDSSKKMDGLRSIDLKHSLVKKNDHKAIRKSPLEANSYYEQFAIERLAVAADTLANLWMGINKQSGVDSWEFFRSYKYILDLDFIEANYIK